ncbi:hypothetical protein ACLB2K_059402 [Fragaria x ananassa]
MGTRKVLWSLAGKLFSVGVVGLCVSDCVASVAPVRGSSMSPTFNPQKTTCMGISTDDYVLMEKFCLNHYQFSHGDIVVFRSPSNHKEYHIKRITALPGDWIGIRKSFYPPIVPEGRCWVEGDNSSSSMDSRTFGTLAIVLHQIAGYSNLQVWLT